MFPDGGSPGLRGWGGLREKAARNEGAGRSGRFGRNSRNNRRGCSFAGPGRGVSGRQLSEDVSGWQRSGTPGLLCGCPLRNAERASGAVVPSSSAGLWADARNRYVPGLREPGGFGTDDVCRLPGSGRAGVGVEEVCCVGVGGGVLGLMGSCRYCGVSDGFDGCGGLQKGLCRRNGDSFRLVHRTDSVPAVRAQKKGTAYTCRYRGPSG